MDDKENSSLNQLKEMIATDSNLNVPIENEFLIKFIRARKCDSVRAFELLCCYYATRKKYKKSYGDFSPMAPRIMKMLELNLLGLLPERDQLGRTIIVVLVGKWKPEISTVDDYFISFQMLMEMALFDTDTQLNGFSFLIDFQDANLNHLRQLTYYNVKKLVTLVQGTFPARIKAIHIVNDNLFFRLAFAIVSPFLKKKIKDRFVFHGKNFENLHQLITPNILPREFGGMQPPFDSTKSIHDLIQCNRKLQELNNKLLH